MGRLEQLTCCRDQRRGDGPRVQAVDRELAILRDLHAPVRDQGATYGGAGGVLEALWWWQFSYLSNWGGTASAALRALQSVVAHVRLDRERVGAGVEGRG